MANCFLTGSHAYGVPNEKSDIDLVILANQELKDKLFKLKNNNSASIRFGKLNIICLTKPEEYDAWLCGTLKCIFNKPVSRNDAINIIQKELKLRCCEVQEDCISNEWI